MNADKALSALIEGNQAFVDANSNAHKMTTKLGEVTTSSQSPFAVILGCSDSRVPAELVFNQGLGDLFVVRVAGNIASPAQIGSIEFACQQFGTQLVVVLGHTHCGAVKATLGALQSNSSEALSSNLLAIVDEIKPAVNDVVNDNGDTEASAVLVAATHANIRQSVKALSLRSRVIRDLIDQRQLKVVGAEYSIETGVVQFFD